MRLSLPLPIDEVSALAASARVAQEAVLLRVLEQRCSDPAAFSTPVGPLTPVPPRAMDMAELRRRMLARCALPYGGTLKIAPTPVGYAGWTDERGNSTVRPTTEYWGIEEQCAVIAHEWGHRAHQRDPGLPDDRPTRADREVEAELAGFGVCYLVGLDTTERALDYLGDWLNRGVSTVPCSVEPRGFVDWLLGRTSRWAAEIAAVLLAPNSPGEERSVGEMASRPRPPTGGQHGRVGTERAWLGTA